MKKIVVSGASSFIGMEFIKYMNSLKYEIIGVVRESCDKILQLEQLENVKIVKCDMKDYNKLGSLVGECDCYLHLAWAGTRGIDRMNSHIQNQSCINSIEAVNSMIEYGCKRVVIAGSQAEYGIRNDEIFETDECYPNTEYGKYKLEFFKNVEKICSVKNVEFKEARIFSIYGPGDHNFTMISTMLKNMIENKDCMLTQSIQKWDFLYIDDAVEAIMKLCTYKCENGVYNVANGNVRELKDFILEMSYITSTKSKLIFGAIEYPNTGMVSLFPNVNKIKTQLKWEAKTSFSTGINEIIKFYSQMN